MSRVIPLPSGKKYHFYVIYNRAGSKVSATADTVLATEVVGHFKKLAEEKGYTKCFDANVDVDTGSADVYGAHFNVMERSMLALVFVTKGFKENGFEMFLQQTTHFNSVTRTERNTCKVMAVLIGVSETVLPKNLIISSYVSFTETDWRDDMEEWNRVWQMMNIHLGPPSPPMDLYRETVAVHPEDSQPLEGTSGASRSAISVNSRNVQLQNEGQSLEVDGPGSFSEETYPKEIVKTDKNTYPSFRNSEIPSQPSEIELDKHSTAGSSGLKHKILQFAIFHVFNGTNQTY